VEQRLDNTRRYQGFGPRPDGMFALHGARMNAADVPPEIVALLPDVVAAAEPFVGTTTDSVPVPDLFALQDESFDPVPARQRLEELAVEDLGVAGEHLGQQ
jgi:hypothetical protein